MIFQLVQQIVNQAPIIASNYSGSLAPGYVDLMALLTAFIHRYLSQPIEQ